MDNGPGDLLLIEWPDLMDDVFISSDRVLFFKQNGGKLYIILLFK